MMRICAGKASVLRECLSKTKFGGLGWEWNTIADAEVQVKRGKGVGPEGSRSACMRAQYHSVAGFVPLRVAN